MGDAKKTLLAFVARLETQESSAQEAGLAALERELAKKDAKSELDALKLRKMFKLVSLLGFVQRSHAKAMTHMRQLGPSSVFLKQIEKFGAPSASLMLPSLVEVDGTSESEVEHSYKLSALAILVLAVASLALCEVPYQTVRRLEDVAVFHCDIARDTAHAALQLGLLERGLEPWPEFECIFEKAAHDIDNIIGKPLFTLNAILEALAALTDNKKRCVVQGALRGIIQSISPKTTDEYRTVIKGLLVSTPGDSASIINFLRTCGPVQSWHPALTALDVSVQSSFVFSDAEEQLMFDKAQLPAGFGDVQVTRNNRSSKGPIIEVDAPEFLAQGKRLRCSPYFEACATSASSKQTNTALEKRSLKEATNVKKPTLRRRALERPTTSTISEPSARVLRSMTTASAPVESGARTLKSVPTTTSSASSTTTVESSARALQTRLARRKLAAS